MASKKIKVLRIINRFNLGGPTYNVAYLTKYLPDEYETLLVGGEKEESEESSDFITHSLGLTPVIIPEMKREIDPVNDWKAYRKIKKIILEFKPDIVHTHASKAGTLGRLAARSCKVPVIVHTFHGHVFHSYFGKLTTAFYKRIERYLASISTCIIAISDKQKEELSIDHKICRPEKIRVVPLGFDLSKFRENRPEKRLQFREYYQVQEDELVISIIGRLVPVKNHELFLRAFELVTKNTKNKIKAFIVGDGESKQEIIDLCLELGLTHSTPESLNPNAQVHFTSWIKDIDRALAGSDIVALTSFNEGTPVSLIEAQAAEKPIVTTNVGGIENIVIPETTALLCADLLPESFAQQLLRLTEQEELRKQLTNKSWEYVRDKFHYTRLVRDIDQLYKELNPTK